MEIFHHIVGLTEKDTEAFGYVVEKGIVVEITPTPTMEKVKMPDKRKGMFILEISELDPRWDCFQEILSRESLLNMTYTMATLDEIKDAPWSWVVTAHDGGYPQPEDDYEVYSQNVYCKKCNIYQQKAPYRIKKEFNLGKNYFHRLFWLGEFFAKPDVFKAFQSQGFKGLDTGDVLIHRTNEKSTSLQQLCIPTIAPVDVSNLGGLKELICPVCGRTRYTFCYRGSLRYKASDMKGIDLDFLTVKHWTGNGGMSWHEILFSQRVVNFILDQNWKGIRFLPVLFES